MYKVFKKIISFIIVINILMTNVFAYTISDIDKNTFMTKAELDALNNEFDARINSYSEMLDSKIDAAISSYLAGITMAKTREIDLRNSVRRVYCMYNRSDTETKEFAYKWTKPKLNGSGVTGVYQSTISGAHGAYMHKWTFNPKTPTPNGERNLIKNYYQVSNSLGYAEWVGHVSGVYDDFTFLVNYINHQGHDAHYSSAPYASIRSADNYIYNQGINETDWVLFKYSAAHPGHWGTAGNNRDYRVGNAVVNAYKLNTDNATYSAKNMIIWKDETYYAFTEEDKASYCLFDANQISGWTESKTTAPKLYTSISKTSLYNNNNVVYLTDYFNSISLDRAYRQHNIDPAGGTVAVNMTNKGNYYNTTSQTGVYVDYLSTNGRLLWPCMGFPYKTINNWNRLYKSENDWAVNGTRVPISTSVFRTDNKNHLSLKGGWPIVEMTRDKKYRFEISFEEAVDHLLFAKLFPFDTESPETENCVIWGTEAPRDNRYNNKGLIIKSGETMKIEILAADNAVLYLKWCDRPDEAIANPEIKGGGTIILPDKVTEITTE